MPNHPSFDQSISNMDSFLASARLLVADKPTRNMAALESMLVPYSIFCLCTDEAWTTWSHETVK